MTITVSSILILLALVFLVIAVTGRLPLWPAVLCLVLERALSVIGLRGP